MEKNQTVVRELLGTLFLKTGLNPVPRMSMNVEKTYSSLHEALQDVMKPGEDAQLEFNAFSVTSGVPRISRGDLDVRRDLSGRVTYVTMPFTKLASIHRLHRVMSLNLRVFDKELPKIRGTCGNPRCTGCGVEKLQPQKRLYALIWESDVVSKLTAEECRNMHCTNAMTGATMEPEPGCHYS